MSLQSIFQNLTLFLDSPNGIARLRKLILQLAVEGKLATQDANDGSADEFVQLLKEQKAKMWSSFKAKKKSAVQISEEEKFCKVPSEWAWVRLNDVGRFTGGATPSTNNPQYWGGDMLWISPKDMKNGRVMGSELKITKSAFERTRLELIPAQSLLIVARSGILRRVLPVAINDVECTVNQDLKVVIPFIDDIAEYVQLMLKGFEDFILATLVKGGMTVQSLKYAEFEQQAFPFPPFEEQKRIIVKVKELMRLCDELEAQQQAKRKSRVRLNTAVLATLNKAASLTPEELEQATARLIDNFDTLYDSIDTVSKLRAAILQLAVQGKLAPQDPRDEPASALLERIEQEKSRMRQKMLLKHEEPAPPVTENDLLFHIPNGWKWSRLSSLCFLITDGTHYTPTYLPSGVPFLSVKDVSSGKIDLTHTKFISHEEHVQLSKRCKPEFEDILFTKVGTTGIAKVIDVKAEFSIFVSLALLKLSKELLSPYFLELLLNSPLVKNQSRRDTQGVGNKNLVLKFIKNFLVPLPPLEEQKRIVAKVNQLMSLCDDLETKLRQAEADSEKLMNAAVKHVLDCVRDTSKTAEEVFA